MQAVLDGLALGYVLEEQPAATADAAGLVKRILGVPDGGVATEDAAATVFGDCVLADVAGDQKLVDERTGVLHLVLQRGSPEIRERGRVLGVDDQLPVQCHETSYTGYRYEVLHAPADLAGWADRSRLTPTPELEISAAEVAEARRLRDALFRVAIARTRGEPPAPGDLDTINEAAAHSPLTPAIASDGARRWAGTASGTQLLATIARDAVELLTGSFAQRVRICAAKDCYLIYVDTSRPGRRRWCSMEHCGNRHKVRTLRVRRSKEGCAAHPRS